MLEKPAGTNLDEFRRLIDLAQRSTSTCRCSTCSATCRRCRRCSGAPEERVRPRLRVPRAPAEGTAQVPAFRRGAGAVQGRHVLRDGRPRHRPDGRASSARPDRSRRSWPTTTPKARRTTSTTAWRCSGTPTPGASSNPGPGGGAHLPALEVYGTGGAVHGPAPGQRPPGEQATCSRSRSTRRREGLAAARPARRRRCRSPTCASSPPAWHGKKQPDFSPEHDLIVQEALLRASGMLGPK